MAYFKMNAANLEKIIKVIFYILLVWLLIQIILKLSGNSPSLDSILTTGLGVIISYLLLATLQISHFTGKTSEFMENSKEAFKRIKKDIEELKDKL